jgi:hypothetical protein
LVGVVVYYAGKKLVKIILRIDKNNSKFSSDESSFADRVTPQIASTPEDNRKNRVREAGEILQKHDLLSVPAVYKVIVNADEFSIFNDPNNIGQIAQALNGLLQHIIGSQDSTNQVELVVTGGNANALVDIRQLLARDLRASVTTLTGDQLKGMDIRDPIQVLTAAGIDVKPSEQTIYVLTSKPRESTGNIIYQQVNDRVLDVALALFSYTHYASPQVVFKNFEERFNLLSIQDTIAIQILVALQA